MINSTEEKGKSLSSPSQPRPKIDSLTAPHRSPVRHVQVCDSREKLWSLPPGPKVVLASLPSLAAGISLQLLVDWGPNPNNLIIFPGQAPVSKLARHLIVPDTMCMPAIGEGKLCLQAARKQRSEQITRSHAFEYHS